MDSKTIPNTAYQAMLAESRKRRQQALALRQGGMSLQEIGTRFGVTRERARQMVAAALKEKQKS